MRFLIQAVDQASVSMQEQPTQTINRGVLIYLGISREDTEDYKEKTERFIEKLGPCKMLKSEDGNISATLHETKGEILLISNFTLYGENKKGSKINFSKSADFETAEKIYNHLVDRLQKNFPIIKTGSFGAMMEVSAINNGPINYLRDY